MSHRTDGTLRADDVLRTEAMNNAVRREEFIDYRLVALVPDLIGPAVD
jgi:hypothetical protein